MKKISLCFLALLLLQASPASAHILSGETGFMAGLKHPVLGLDHFLAMVSVGIISAQIGGRAIWSVPATFVAMMALGGIFGIENLTLPFSEYILAFSVFALGLSIAASRRMPIMLAMVFVGVFGMFHGYAHGIEMPHVAKPVPYALGFITGTASLHIAGVLIGVVSNWFKQGGTLLRYAGAIIAGMGLELIIVMKDLC